MSLSLRSRLTRRYTHSKAQCHKLTRHKLTLDVTQLHCSRLLAARSVALHSAFDLERLKLFLNEIASLKLSKRWRCACFIRSMASHPFRSFSTIFKRFVSALFQNGYKVFTFMLLNP